MPIKKFSATVLSAEKEEKGLSATSSGEGLEPRRCMQHLLPSGHTPLQVFSNFSPSVCYSSPWKERKKGGGGVTGWGPAWNLTYPWFVYPEQSSSVMQLKPVFFSLHFTYPQHVPYNLILQQGSRLKRERHSRPDLLPYKDFLGLGSCKKNGLTTVAIRIKCDCSITTFIDACPRNIALVTLS